MIALIDVKNSSDQSVGISTGITPQSIQITNTDRQEIAISLSNEGQKVDILNTGGKQAIQILTPWVARKDLENYVPKELSIFPSAESESFDGVADREVSRIYVDINGTPSYATLEQIKKLNTKTLLTDNLSDTKIKKLSDEDIVLLRKD